mgnify:CR=1 FL=1
MQRLYKLQTPTSLPTSIHLSKTGEIAKECLLDIPTHFSFVDVDEFVVMPNHVHMIIIITKSNVETLHATSLPEGRQRMYMGPNKRLSTISPQKYTLSSIIRSYKSAVSRQANNISNTENFYWQSRFHDRVIRNEKELNSIRQYIIDNPKNWEKDELYL